MTAPKIKLTPYQVQLLAAGLVIAGCFGFIYFRYFWSPMSDRIAKAAASIEEVQGKIDKATAQAARLPVIQKQLVVLSEQAADAEKRLPKKKDLPAVIDTLSALSSKYKVSLSNFTPGGASPKQFFIEVPYTVAATGTFHNIGRFFAAVALEERIFSVRNVTFAGGGSSADGKLTVNFTLIAYQYKG